MELSLSGGERMGLPAGLNPTIVAVGAEVWNGGVGLMG